MALQCLLPTTGQQAVPSRGRWCHPGEASGTRVHACVPAFSLLSLHTRPAHLLNAGGTPAVACGICPPPVRQPRRHARMHAAQLVPLNPQDQQQQQQQQGQQLQQQGQQQQQQQQQGQCVVGLTVMLDLPRFDQPLLLGEVIRLKRAACVVRHGDGLFLCTHASSVLYATQVGLLLSEGAV